MMDTLYGAVVRTNITKKVLVLLSTNIAKSVMECRPISSRILTMQLAGQSLNISLIQVYAPTSTVSDDEMKQFYQHL